MTQVSPEENGNWPSSKQAEIDIDELAEQVSLFSTLRLKALLNRTKNHGTVVCENSPNFEELVAKVNCVHIQMDFPWDYNQSETSSSVDTKSSYRPCNPVCTAQCDFFLIFNSP